MIKKVIFAFAILALALATAGTVPATGSYKITLTQPTVVNGTELKAGDYRLTLGAEKITIQNGKTPLEVPAKIELSEQKIETTSIRFNTATGKAVLTEIRLGGSKTIIVFNP